jgi:hypothetical protein
MVNDQLDTQFFFLLYLFQFCTCFKQPRAHHEENQYNIWYMSLCVGDHLICSFPNCVLDGHVVTHTRCCTDTIESPDDEHEVARNT